MELRPYQNEIISILEKDCQRPCKEIVQLPTGMGKTVVFSSLIRNLGKKTLVLAHREELLNQAKDKMIACGVQGHIDIVLQSKPDPFADHWVASVQTLARRNLKDMSPELMIIDECHHSIAATYRRIVEAFSNIPIIGFTATPTRTGKKEKEEFGAMWDKIAYEYNIKKAILDGWLANIRYYQVKTGISLDDVRSHNGDFDEKDLSEKVNTKARNVATLEKYNSLGGGKAVIFCVDCEHCEEMTRTFTDAGIETHCILGSTKDRYDVLQRFQQASMTQNIVLVNCMVLTEGWDCPNVRMIVLARPTVSPIVYLQQLGRGTRIAPPEKSEIIVVDIADNCKKRQLCNVLRTVFNLRKEVEIEGDIVGRLMGNGGCEGKKKDEQLDDAIEQENVEIELAKILFDMPEELERSELAWFAPTEKQFFCQINKDLTLRIDDKMLKYELWLCEKNQQPALQIDDPDLSLILDKAFDIASSPEFKNTSYFWDKRRRKNMSNFSVSEKQKAFLAKIAPNIDPSSISRETASQIISAHIAKKDKTKGEPPTPKQLWFLRKIGCSIVPATKGDATRLIAQSKGAVTCQQM